MLTCKRIDDSIEEAIRDSNVLSTQSAQLQDCSCCRIGLHNRASNEAVGKAHIRRLLKESSDTNS